MEHVLYYCEVCDVRASSEEQLRSHLLGQRHWFNKRQLEIAHRSVYVTGFKGSEDKDAVCEAFQQFGSVHKVVMVTENRPRVFAIVEFSDVDSALRALRHSDELVFQGSPLKVKPREAKTKEPRPTSRSSSSIDDSKEGTSAAAMEEDRVSTWRDTLGSCLNISADDISKLEQAELGDDQIRLIASLSQLPHEALQQRLTIISLLETHFRSALPNCRVLPFGSFVTGLSTTTSDLDLILLTEVTEEDEKHFTPSAGYAPFLTTPPLLAASSECDDSSIMDISSESVFSKGDTGLSESVFSKGDTGLSEFDNVLSTLRNIPGCTKVFGIPNARCPIIKFLHQSTGVHCDISINNRLALYNTQLIKSYLQCDHRVAPLLLMLRIWSRACGLMGHSRSLLNNYSLTLMLIAALQSTSPAVLPSLQSPAPWPKNMEWYLTHSEEMSSPLMIDGWNARYCEPGSLKPSENTDTLSELLHHFFNFYISFQFGKNAVTIHTPCGHVTSKEEALDSAQSDPRGFKISVMCVQDPLELSHNVTKSLNHKIFRTLQHELRRACQIMIAEQGVLELLSPPSDEAATTSSKPIKNTFTLVLSLEHIKILLFHCADSKLHAVGDMVTQLDYSNDDTLHKLCVLTCQALASYWTPLHVVCSPIMTTPPTLQDVTMDTVSTGQSTARKRPREEEVEPEDDDAMMSSQEESKRRKVPSSHTPSVLDEILSTDPSLSSSMSCSFHHSTQRQHQEESTVRFTMEVTPCGTGRDVAIKLTGDNPEHASLLANRYAVYKKTINNIIYRQTTS